MSFVINIKGHHMHTKNYLILLVCFALTSCGQSTVAEEEEYPLAEKMSYYQRYAQKLGLAGEQQNWELADFYLHELHEISEELIEEQVKYEEYEIGNLVKKMLEPAIEGAEKAIENKDSVLFKTNYKMLINNCNACHTATKHEFIKVTIPKSNPYNQNFE